EEAEELARLEAEAEQARLEQEARERAEAEQRAREAEERLAAEALERERLEQERLEQERLEQEQAEEQRRLEAEVQARREAEELARHEAEEQARREAEEHARREAEEWAALEAEEEARLAAEAAAAAAPLQEGAEADAETGEEAAPHEAAHQDWARTEDPDAPMDLADVDEELLDIFLEEGGDILDHSDGLLASLRQNPSDRELVVGLQRDLHTLKGGARMAGLPQIGDLGHAMESLLEAVADGRRELHASGVEVLERAFDRLHAMVTRVGERRAIAMPTALVERVEALVRGEVHEAPV